MVTFFFYKNFVSTEMLSKISNNFQCVDGYVIVEDFDLDQDLVLINRDSNKNNVLLHGKIVYFAMTANDVVKNIEKCKLCTKQKYTMETIWVNKARGGLEKAFIIY